MTKITYFLFQFILSLSCGFGSYFIYNPLFSESGSNFIEKAFLAFYIPALISIILFALLKNKKHLNFLKIIKTVVFGISGIILGFLATFGLESVVGFIDSSYASLILSFTIVPVLFAIYFINLAVK